MLSWTRSFFRTLRTPTSTEAGAVAHLDGRPVFALPPSTPSPLPPGAGDLLSGRYRLDALVGKGSTSYVYRATDFVLAEEVAIKVLVRRGADRSQGPANESAAEAAAALRLSHPNIARVFHLDRHDHWPYLVMELVPGVDLHRHAKGAPGQRLPLREILRIGTSCLDALSYAHACGVVHNDVKPSNLIVTSSGALKLCDFGLARLAEESPGAWVAASSAGAPAFMSPERIKGDRSSPQSDLYSTAATLYALTTGRTLFGAEMAQAWRGHLELDVPPSPHVPTPLFRVLQTALAKDPALRFESAAQMHAALVNAFADIDDDTGTVVDAVHVVDDVDILPAGTLAHARSVAPRDEPPTQSDVFARLRPAPPPARRTHDVVPARASAPALRVAAPAGMVRVPALRLTSQHGGVHEVAAFFLDRTPVTNAQYKRFIDETGALPPQHWLGARCPPGRADHPVVGVSLAAARRYAAWAGMRLPSDVEWEAAARGDDGRAFPWGPDFDAARVHGPDSHARDTCRVGANPESASPCGALDLVGNVWEWTCPDTGAHAAEPGAAWVFGGSFRHPCVKDGAIARTSVAVDKEYLYLGFRCAQSERGAR